MRVNGQRGRFLRLLFVFIWLNPLPILGLHIAFIGLSYFYICCLLQGFRLNYQGFPQDQSSTIKQSPSLSLFQECPLLVFFYIHIIIGCADMKAQKSYDDKFESNLDHKDQIFFACNYYSFFLSSLLSALASLKFLPYSLIISKHCYILSSYQLTIFSSLLSSESSRYCLYLFIYASIQDSSFSYFVFKFLISSINYCSLEDTDVVFCILLYSFLRLFNGSDLVEWGPRIRDTLFGFRMFQFYPLQPGTQSAYIIGLFDCDIVFVLLVIKDYLNCMS